MSTLQATSETYPIPLGSIFYFASTTGNKGGFLPADGSAISRETYWELFSYIGTGYGAGDGSTTFNLPDLNTYPYIRGVASQTFIAPTSGGGSGSSGFTIPVGALPSLSNTAFSNNLTFSASTPVNHATMGDSRKFDGGGVGTNTVINDSSTGTEAYVTMSALTVSYSNPTPSQVSITAGGSGLVLGGLEMVAYIKAWSNVGAFPSPKPFQLPTVPASDSFFAPYQNIPYLGGLPIV